MYNPVVGSLRRRLLALALLGGVLVLSAPAGGSHGSKTWAGSWTTSTGSFALRVLTASEIATAKKSKDRLELWNKLPCKEASQFYRGGYATSGGDKGKIMGCSTGNALRGRYTSNQIRKNTEYGFAAGGFTATVSSRNPLKFAGTYRLDGTGTTEQWSGNWKGHFNGDNCCARGGGGGGGGGGTPAGDLSDSDFEVDVRFHANNLQTAPPADGGRCPEARVRARITGTIIGRRFHPHGGGPLEIQGGGDVADTPHLNRCRVPVINVRVLNAELRIISPGKRMRAQLDVRISSAGTHRPGQCRVGTRGTIVAIYDNTLTVSNGLRDHRLTIGPWQSLCEAHNHSITNFITSIPAGASSSTWVRVQISCYPEPGETGLGPANCDN